MPNPGFTGKALAIPWRHCEEGYGALSISVSGFDATVAYIQNQTEHHRTRSFREEFVSMLKKHRFPFDESMLV